MHRIAKRIVVPWSVVVLGDSKCIFFMFRVCVSVGSGMSAGKRSALHPAASFP
jgi:hypothetical protein